MSLLVFESKYFLNEIQSDFENEENACISLAFFKIITRILDYYQYHYTIVFQLLTRNYYLLVYINIQGLLEFIALLAPLYYSSFKI